MPRTRRSRLRSLRSRAVCDAELFDQRAADQSRTDHARPRWCSATGRSWHARRAAPWSHRARSITTEMFRSDAPCAIARTLTAAFDSALNTFAAAPGVPAMPSPTTARMLQSVGDRDLLDLAVAQLGFERLADDPLGQRRLRSRHREADRMLRAGLRDEDHGDLMLAQRGEQALRRAGHADHAGALDVDQRHLIDRRDALHRVARRRLARRSACRRARARRCCGSRSECPSPPPAPWSADAAPSRRNRRAPSLPRTTSGR